MAAISKISRPVPNFEKSLKFWLVLFGLELAGNWIRISHFQDTRRDRDGRVFFSFLREKNDFYKML